LVLERLLRGCRQLKSLLPLLLLLLPLLGHCYVVVTRNLLAWKAPFMVSAVVQLPQECFELNIRCDNNRPAVAPQPLLLLLLLLVAAAFKLDTCRASSGSSSSSSSCQGQAC
jgi:hypothetical protein